MTTEFELQLLQEIEALKQKVQELEGKTDYQIPIYQYSKIRERDLKTLFDIEKKLDERKFDAWFAARVEIDPTIEAFLRELLDQNKLLIDSYSEEDLKIHMIAPILNKVRFTSYEQNIRDF